MDYGHDDCLIAFSNDQVLRMQNALFGPRSSILSSNGCNGTPNCFNQGTNIMTLELTTDNFPEETNLAFHYIR